MLHHCEGACVTCIDYRLHPRKDGRNYVGDYIQSFCIDCDLITRAGGVQDILRPVEGSADHLLRDVHISHSLHKADIIILINHEDCGAYAAFGFRSREEEIMRHHRDIHNSLTILRLPFPSKWIIGSFAELEPGTDDIFHIKSVIEIKPSVRQGHKSRWV